MSITLCDRCDHGATVKVKLEGKVVHVFCRDHAAEFVDEIEEFSRITIPSRDIDSIVKKICQGE